MVLYWIWLAELPDIQLWQKHVLLQYFHDPEELYNASSETYRTVPGMTESMLSALENKNLATAREIISTCENKHIYILTPKDDSYPRRLKGLRDAPLVLYVKGVLPAINDTPTVAIIGTRRATSYGMNISRRMGAQIAACGGIVVSGGAFGNDTMALRGALATEAPVVAVLACGVDVVYPKSNTALFAQIQEQGCLISEYPPGTPPYKWNFPVRNRILSGLSNGVLVVEAPEGSGALITARLALEQGRDVFAVPGNIDVPTCVGSNALLQDRASAVFTGWDILREYAPLYPGKVREVPLAQIAQIADTLEEKVSQTVEIPKKSQPKREKSEKLTIDKEEKSSYSVISEPLPKLTSEEQAVLSHITKAPRAVDDVILEAGIPAYKVLPLLTMLSVKGLVVNHPGGQVSLK